MKKVIVLASFLGAALLSNAQVSFGPFVGIGVQGPRSLTFGGSTTSTTTNAQGEVLDTQTDPSSAGAGISIIPKAGLSYKVGVTAKIDINDYFALSPGIAFQNMSSKLDVLGFSQKTSINYVAIPILIQGQYPINDKINIGLGIGPEFNILLGGKSTSTFAGTSTTAKIKAKSTITEADEKVNQDADNGNNIDYQKGVNISFLIAPFIQFKFGGASLMVSPTYYIGLTNINPPTKYSTSATYGSGNYAITSTTSYDLKDKIKTGGFGVNVALLFGGGK